MNGLDVFLVVLLALAGLSGYRRGLTLQALSFGGLLVGLAVGALAAPTIARLVDSPAAQASVAVIALLALAAAGDAAGWLLGSRLRDRARATRFGSADAVGGSAVAVVASLLAIWFVSLNLVSGPFPRVAAEIRGSAVVRTLDDALPRPPSLLAEVRRFFNRFGFPDVFSGIPPLPADPVDPPSPAEARQAFELAAPSTVRIAGEACGGVQEGSGFVVADGYVVTNAHVVAGMDDPFVQTSDGGSQTGRTVLFDPELDLAVLLVARAPGPPLAFGSGAGRGTAGAVLGYPGGGPLTGDRAAVLRTIDAVGRDIYGQGEAERTVLELQAEVRPGNSGGPFVVGDGRVVGVVFAASSSDQDVGYAIAAEEVAPRVRQAVGATGEVSTGPCVR
ncbi:MAG TPA: MarP family serine protease [Actinomycetota bacterium]|nr:MarP family serine protease [Actinomycetota bacterium]